LPVKKFSDIAGTSCSRLLHKLFGTNKKKPGREFKGKIRRVTLAVSPTRKGIKDKRL